MDNSQNSNITELRQKVVEKITGSVKGELTPSNQDMVELLRWTNDLSTTQLENYLAHGVTDLQIVNGVVQDADNALPTPAISAITKAVADELPTHRWNKSDPQPSRANEEIQKSGPQWGEIFTPVTETQDISSLYKPKENTDITIEHTIVTPAEGPVSAPLLPVTGSIILPITPITDVNTVYSSPITKDLLSITPVEERWAAPATPDAGEPIARNAAPPAIGPTPVYRQPGQNESVFSNSDGSVRFTNNVTGEHRDEWPIDQHDIEQPILVNPGREIVSVVDENGNSIPQPFPQYGGPTDNVGSTTDGVLNQAAMIAKNGLLSGGESSNTMSSRQAAPAYRFVNPSNPSNNQFASQSQHEVAEFSGGGAFISSPTAPTAMAIVPAASSSNNGLPTSNNMPNFDINIGGIL